MLGIHSGFTRSGKEVYCYPLGKEEKNNHPLNINFSYEDYFDGYALFEYLALEERRKDIKSKWFIHYQDSLLFRKK